MEKKLELWRFVAERLKLGETLMLLVVAESRGSSPGRKGFKMAVASSGEMRGSIGGGVMEVRLVEQAREILDAGDERREDEETRRRGAKAGSRKPPSEIQNPKSKILEQDHRKNSAHPSGMICSGKQTVIFYRLGAGDLDAVLAIIGALEEYRPEILRISDSKFQISNRETADFEFRFKRSAENEFVYEERLGFENTLYIVGGGHCALALSELMSRMDFRIALFDDRPFLNTLAKNRFAHEIKIVDSYEEIDRFIRSSPKTYVVVMTLGYKSDETVIRKLLDRDFKYFGVMGSRAKMKTLLKNLEKENLPPERLARIRTPIGLPINSRTPEEIAVSIAAEIIKVKNENR